MKFSSTKEIDEGELSDHEANNCEKQPTTLVLYSNHTARTMKAKEICFLEVRSCDYRAPARPFDVKTSIVDPSLTF